MIKYIAYLLFPILMLSISNVNAEHKMWHVLYAEPDKYCIDKTICKGRKKCLNYLRIIKRNQQLRWCSSKVVVETIAASTSGGDTTTTDTKSCPEGDVLDTVTNTCVTPEPEPPICVEPEVLDTVTNTCANHSLSTII